MSEQKMREAFEKWAKDKGLIRDAYGMRSAASVTEICWAAWQDALRSAGERNQCDGCMSGAELDGNMHRSEDGKPFMVCQRHRYAVEQGREAVAEICADVGHAMNSALCDFSMRWTLDGDYLRCRKCSRPQLASKADQTFRHAEGCKAEGKTEDKPWQELMRRTAPIYDAAPPAITEAAWLRVVDEELVCAHLGVASASDDYDTAKRKINDLICWHIDVATDPRVNGGKHLAPVITEAEMREALEEVAKADFGSDLGISAGLVTWKVPGIIAALRKLGIEVTP